MKDQDIEGGNRQVRSIIIAGTQVVALVSDVLDADVNEAAARGDWRPFWKRLVLLLAAWLILSAACSLAAGCWVLLVVTGSDGGTK